MNIPTDLLHKGAPLTILDATKSAGADDKPQGKMQAIVSVFGNVDYSKERIVYGAYQKTLARKLPKGVWAHDWDRPVAKTLAARELAPGDADLPDELKEFGGLWVDALFNLDTKDGYDAFSNVQGGFFDEFSVGYRVVGSRDAEDGVRELLEMDLWEWSPVLVGCNPLTAPLGAKSAPIRADDSASYSLHLRGALALAGIDL